MSNSADTCLSTTITTKSNPPIVLSPLLFVTAIFLSSRLWTAIFVYLGHASRPFLEPIPGGWEGVANWWLNAWTAYDSLWFLNIARSGYELSTTTFFPLYPLLLRLAGTDPIVLAAWGVLLSNITFFGALYFFYRLTARDYDDRIARFSVAFLAFFPTTSHFSAVYTESLFLLLLTACFLCVRTERWGWAILWSALAALVRNSGPLLVLMLAWEAVSAARRSGFKPILPFLPLAPAAAFVAVQLYFRSAGFGNLASLESQSFYNRQLTWPWMPILLDIKKLFRPEYFFHILQLSAVVFSILAFLFVWRYWRKQPISYSIFVLGINLMNLTYSHQSWSHTLPIIRYLMTTFPFLQNLAHELSPLWERRLSRFLFITIYLFTCAVFSYLFGIKTFSG